MIPTLALFALKYGVPLVIYAAGHLIGWIHGRVTAPQPPAAGKGTDGTVDSSGAAHGQANTH